MWTAPAVVAVSSGAGHLGDCTVCPIAELEASEHLVAPLLEEYRAVKRLGMTPQHIQAMLVLDEEVERLRAKEAERAKME